MESIFFPYTPNYVYTQLVKIEPCFVQFVLARGNKIELNENKLLNSLEIIGYGLLSINLI